MDVAQSTFVVSQCDLSFIYCFSDRVVNEAEEETPIHSTVKVADVLDCSDIDDFIQKIRCKKGYEVTERKY